MIEGSRLNALRRLGGAYVVRCERMQLEIPIRESMKLVATRFDNVVERTAARSSEFGGLARSGHLRFLDVVIYDVRNYRRDLWINDADSLNCINIVGNAAAVDGVGRRKRV